MRQAIAEKFLDDRPAPAGLRTPPAGATSLTANPWSAKVISGTHLRRPKPGLRARDS